MALWSTWGTSNANLISMRRSKFKFTFLRLKSINQSITWPWFRAVLRNDFRENPSNFEGIEGDEIFLTCKPPKGSPEPKVKWKKNGKELNIDESGRYFTSPTNGLRIVKSTTQDSALYSCVAYNVAGEKDSQPAVVVVKSELEMNLNWS